MDRNDSTSGVDRSQLERMLIEHASPTLANLKIGSLFAAPDITPEEIDDLNSKFAEKGLQLRLLNGKRKLVYLYRVAELARTLEEPDITGFLEACGYRSSGIDAALRHLEERMLPCGEFPHEIGIFLGYPLADVLGFIINSGKNCLCCGCWKVYSDQCSAMRSFAKFRKCKEVYRRLFASGVPLMKLSVATRL